MRARWTLAVDWNDDYRRGTVTVRRLVDGVAEELYDRSCDEWSMAMTFWKAASIVFGDARLSEMPQAAGLFPDDD